MQQMLELESSGHQTAPTGLLLEILSCKMISRICSKLNFALLNRFEWTAEPNCHNPDLLQLPSIHPLFPEATQTGYGRVVGPTITRS